MKLFIFSTITAYLFVRYCLFLLEYYNYKAKRRRHNSGHPKAHDFDTEKPKLF